LLIRIAKESRTANEGWSFSLGLGELLTNPHSKNSLCYKTGAVDWEYNNT